MIFMEALWLIYYHFLPIAFYQRLVRYSEGSKISSVYIPTHMFEVFLYLCFLTRMTEQTLNSLAFNKVINEFTT